MRDIFSVLFLGFICIVLPGSLIITDFVLFVKKKEVFLFELIAFIIGAIDTGIIYWTWDPSDYSIPLNTYGSIHAHEPFSSHEMPTLLVLIGFGFLCYLILKFLRKKLPPLVEVILLGGIYIGCGVLLVCMFQLLCGANPEGVSLMFTDYITILLLLITPTIFLLHVLQLLLRLIRERAEKQASLHYTNKVLQRLNQWFFKGSNLFIVPLLLMIPLLVLLMMILCLFGQQPDSILLAFTNTSDWILSQQVAPPPLAYDEHYLCTVSLRGHKKVVKPIRCGVRRGRKIIVNRQLCIANAFEQLIMERTPRFHRALRNFYDTYGYPISRHINNAWTADLTYFIMKPLEWFFVIILYLFDVNPEDRICIQYLPQREGPINKAFYDTNTDIEG